MATRTKFVKPEQRRIRTADTLATTRVGHSFIRVTVGGPDLNDFTQMGHDQWFRLFLQREEQEKLCLPTAPDDWYPQYLAMNDDARPRVRSYTVRGFRPARAAVYGDDAELDIDFVAHGDSGQASAWAETATPGAPVGFLDEGVMYQAPPHTDQVLLVGDESALPAMAGVLRSASPELRGAAYLEVPYTEDIQDLDVPGGVAVHWLPRNGSQTTNGALAIEAVRNAELPQTGLYAFIAGEQDLATGVRRHLVRERGIAKSDITFTGYWRMGATRAD